VRRSRTPRGDAEPSLRELRRRCERLLDDNGILVPSPFDRHELVDVIGQRRQHPIELRNLPVPVPDCGYSGVWVHTATLDLIFVDATRSSWEQDHITAHEVGHILFGHAASDVDLGEILLPDLDMSVVRAMLGRHDFSTGQEREAEMMATVIIDRAARSAPTASPRLAQVTDALSLDDV
jgi:hypothetical protein